MFESGQIVKHSVTGSIYRIVSEHPGGEGFVCDPMNGAGPVYCDTFRLKAATDEDQNWDALEDAERKLYHDDARYGALGFTDVNVQDDDCITIYHEMWKYADISVDCLVDPDNDDQRRKLVAGRVARAFAVLAFGVEVGADDA